MLLICSSPLLAGSYTEKNKTISKSYTVEAATLVGIDNAFGTVEVTGWDQKQVEVFIEIKVEAKNDADAQRLLDRISVEIDDNKPGSQLRFRTVMQEKNGWGSSAEHFEINYKVKMPAANTLYVDNRHGETVLGDFTGEINVETRHGNLRAGKLSGEVDIEVSFGSIYAGMLGAGKLQLRHSSNSEVRSMGALRLDVEHSELEVGESKDIDLSLRHSELEVDNGTMIDGTVQHSELEIGKLSKGISLSIQHSSLEVDELAKGFSLLDLDMQFTSVDVEIVQGASFSFDAEMTFGDIDIPSSGFNVSHREKENHSIRYKGQAGSGSDARVRINGSHGNVDLSWK